MSPIPPHHHSHLQLPTSPRTLPHNGRHINSTPRLSRPGTFPSLPPPLVSPTSLTLLPHSSPPNSPPPYPTLSSTLPPPLTAPPPPLPPKTPTPQPPPPPTSTINLLSPPPLPSPPSTKPPPPPPPQPSQPRNTNSPPTSFSKPPRSTL